MAATHQIDDVKAASTRNAKPSSLGRLAAGYGAVLAIAPYIVLKVAWVAEIPWGWEDGGVIAGDAMVAGDAVTGAMATVGALLALAFTHGWGLRAPTWLVLFPAWVGAGLLVPIVAGLPLYGLLVAAGRLPSPDAEGRASWWLFPLVYATFFCLGVGLLASCGFYARDRWGRLLGGVVGDEGRGATGPLQAILARVTATIASGIVLANLYWLLGGTAGLDLRRLAERDYVVAQGNVVAAVGAGGMAVGLLLLTGDLGRGKPFGVALALAGVGSAVLFAQGTLNLAFGWLVTATGGIGNLATEVPSPQRRVVYDVMSFFGVVGAGLGAVVTLVHLAERGAALDGAPEWERPRPRAPLAPTPAAPGSGQVNGSAPIVGAARRGRERMGAGARQAGGSEQAGVNGAVPGASTRSTSSRNRG